MKTFIVASETIITGFMDSLSFVPASRKSVHLPNGFDSTACQRPDDRCNCRKPNPGLLSEAAEDLPLELSSSYLVGDTVADIQVAKAVSVQGVLALAGRGAAQTTLSNQMNLDNFWKVDDLSSTIIGILDEKK